MSGEAGPWERAHNAPEHARGRDFGARRVARPMASRRRLPDEKVHTDGFLGPWCTYLARS
jgi:hypothetical protein